MPTRTKKVVASVVGCVLVVVLVAAGLIANAVTSHSAATPVTKHGSPWSLQEITAAQHPVLNFQTTKVDPAAPVSSGITLVARLKNNVLGYNSPGGPAVRTVPGSWYGIPSVLPVMQRAAGGWLRVRLAQRPDESTSWIKDTDVVLSKTPYEIVINLKTTHLYLYKDNKQMFSFPAGVGTSWDPTPTGHYFVAFVYPPPAGEEYLYGPFLLYTSDHSKAIEDWDGSGDAILAIHGPIGADAEIGSTGAYISHGCIRLHVPDLMKLSVVPPGTPIDIID